MGEAIPDPGLLSDREMFLDRIIDKIGHHRCLFEDYFTGTHASEDPTSRRSAAGVLMPLFYKKDGSGGKGQFVFQLIKRSSNVPQSGDLGLPGGMLHPLLDRLLRSLLIHGPFPVLTGKALEYSRQHKGSFQLITLFLANALRETWEETGLSPFRVRFLGPLPPYNLYLFRRTIFPLAGFVDCSGGLHPNPEVEKLVQIPISLFYRDDAFRCCQVDASISTKGAVSQYPCLIYRDFDGKEEVLWGATFHIIVDFLSIVMDYRLPEWRNRPVIFKTISYDYLTGRQRS